MSSGKHTEAAQATQSERNRKAIRKIIMLVVFIVIFFAWAGVMIVNFGQQIKHQQTTNHDNRIADQHRTDREIAQLACLVVSQTNEDDPKFDPNARNAIKQFRKAYGCPPFSKATARNPFGKSAQPTPTRPVPTGFLPSSMPGTPGHSVTVQPDGVRTVNGVRTSPANSPTKPKPTPTPTKTPLIKVCPSQIPVIGPVLCVEV